MRPRKNRRRKGCSGCNRKWASLRADNAVLREQLSLRDQALDATPTFFVISKLAAPEPIIVYCNKVVAEEHGSPRNELIGKGISTLARWASSDAAGSDVSAALRAGHTYHHEPRGHAAGRQQVLAGSVDQMPIFDGAGDLTHSVAIGADITAKRDEVFKKQELQDKLVDEMKERARVVIELQLAQKLESVGRLAAGIAHEINTPIQYVGDGVYFLHSAYGRLQPADRRLAKCRRGTARDPALRGASPRSRQVDGKNMT